LVSATISAKMSIRVAFRGLCFPCWGFLKFSGSSRITRAKNSGMSIDPEILLGLQNYKQNQSSLELQREILAMQKLQVLNQIRISEGLPPLAELPKPPPPPERTPEEIAEGHRKARKTLFKVLALVFVFLLLAIYALGLK